MIKYIQKLFYTTSLKLIIIYEWYYNFIHQTYDVSKYLLRFYKEALFVFDYIIRDLKYGLPLLLLLFTLSLKNILFKSVFHIVLYIIFVLFIPNNEKKLLLISVLESFTTTKCKHML